MVSEIAGGSKTLNMRASKDGNASKIPPDCGCPWVAMITYDQVESSKNIEMVNIIDDELWNTEPALRPEDEIILRKLHEMLQSTADDLKLLSGELSKFHEPGVQFKTAPTPLDEEFNEKVHIEELVNAKFNGHKVVDKSPHAPGPIIVRGVTDKPKPVLNFKRPKVNNIGVQVNAAPALQIKPVNRNFGISRTKVIQISDKRQDNKNNEKLNNCKVINNTPAIAYNEFCYKYVEQKSKQNSRNVLQVQEMPSINIRSELKKQKVLSIDIFPECRDSKQFTSSRNNVSVVTIQHETEPKQVPVTTNEPVQHKQPNYKMPVRKVYKMSTCDSSGSTNNVCSDAPTMPQMLKIQSNIRNSPKSIRRIDRSKKNIGSRKEPEKHLHLNLEEWKKKLSKVYGPSSSRKSGLTPKAKNNKRTHAGKIILKPTKLNNAEYIPYSQLTLGGVRVSDIEREISKIPNKNDVPLNPILDRILNSRENSPRKCKRKKNPRVLTTSDENLLQEVLDIEKTVSETISKNLSKKSIEVTKVRYTSDDSDVENNETYVDDFEDEESEQTGKSANNSNQNDSQSDISEKSRSEDVSDSPGKDDHFEKPETYKIQNTTNTKTSNLSFKDSVDIFEFVHSIDRQDTGTQSSIASKIIPKETQTSPRNANNNIHPIHNDLWTSIDPTGEVENMFKLEKDFIKKLIMDEYGDLLEKNLTKPSTSKDSIAENDKNVAASQKNTQTSPARVKSVMTSPKKTKTRTTSPLTLSLAVDHQTSPMIFGTEDRGVNINNDDLDISINLSSPRFSLRLPQNSRDVLSSLGRCSKPPSKIDLKLKTFAKSSTKSSTSIDADNSSSEISSLGEIKLKLNRRFKANRVQTVSELSSTSTFSQCSSDVFLGCMLPLRSEGEVTAGQGTKNKSKSDGETSIDLLN